MPNSTDDRGDQRKLKPVDTDIANVIVLTAILEELVKSGTAKSARLIERLDELRGHDSSPGVDMLVNYYQGVVRKTSKGGS